MMTVFAQLVLSDPKQAAEQLRPLIEAGLTAPQIAAKFEVNESTARRWIYRLRDSGHLVAMLKLGPRGRRGVPFAKAQRAPGAKKKRRNKADPKK